MDIQVILQNIREDNFSSVYLLQGTEQYLIDLFKSTLTNKMIQTEDDKLNFSSFNMNEVPLDQVIDEADTLPFFGDYRIVMMEQPYFLTAEKKTTGIEHNVERLIEYLSQPSPTTILVIIANVEKLDERKKVTKALKKKATIVDVSPMKEKEVRAYVQQTITNEGYSITSKAFDLLLHLTDFNLSKIMGELQKLFLFSPEDKKISQENVQDLVPKSLEHNVFDLTERVLTGKGDQALMLYEELLLQGEETIKLNAILLNQIRLFIQTKILIALGYQQSNIVETLKIHPYRVKLAMQQVRKFKLEQLEKMYDELVENDYKMKTAQLNKTLLFELFILKMVKYFQ